VYEDSRGGGGEAKQYVKIDKLIKEERDNTNIKN
jgi:hypothetical protein